jgi:hypothetical protein
MRDLPRGNFIKGLEINEKLEDQGKDGAISFESQ